MSQLRKKLQERNRIKLASIPRPIPGMSYRNTGKTIGGRKIWQLIVPATENLLGR